MREGEREIVCIRVRDGQREREKERENREQRKRSGYYLYIHVSRGRARGSRREQRSEMWEGYAATIRTDRKFVGALVRISNTDRIQGIFLGQCLRLISE